MNKIKFVFSILKAGFKFLVNQIKNNKVVLKNNKNTKIFKNEIKDINLKITRNDKCEIYENKFIKK